MNENRFPTPEEQKLISGFALTQLWGFIGPGFNVLGPLIYHFMHRESGPLVTKAFRAIMNLQISWSIYLAVPMIFLHNLCREVDIWAIIDILKQNTDPYMAAYVDPLSYIQPLLYLMLFLVAELFITMIWVSVTLKLIFEFKKGNISYRGMLGIPFLR